MKLHGMTVKQQATLYSKINKSGESTRVSQDTYVSQCLHPISVQWVCPILRNRVKIHVHTVHVYIYRRLANRTITGYISFYPPVTSSPTRLTAQSHTRCTNTEPLTIRHMDVARFNTLLQNTSLRNLPLKSATGRFRWPRGLRSGSAVSRLLALWIRIQPGAWMSVSGESCALSGRRLCDMPIPRPEEFCVCVCVRHRLRLGGNNPLYLQ